MKKNTNNNHNVETKASATGIGEKWLYRFSLLSHVVVGLYVFIFASPFYIMTYIPLWVILFNFSRKTWVRVCIFVLHVPPNTHIHSHKSRIIAHHLFRHFRDGVNLQTVNTGVGKSIVVVYCDVQTIAVSLVKI